MIPTPLPMLTGLPESLVDAYASASESEEDDEADEDSNGASHYPDKENSDYDLSGSDDGTCPYMSCHFLSL